MKKDKLISRLNLSDVGGKVLKWLGKPVNRENDYDRIDRNEGNQRYEKCSIDDFVVSVGDFVLINNYDDPEDVSTAYIAEITEMFDSGKKGGDNFRGLVQWYTRDRELSDLVKKKFAVDKNEVLLNQMNFDREIDLETVLGLIQVSKVAGPGEEEGFFYAGRCYDGKKVASVVKDAPLKRTDNFGPTWLGEVSRSGRKVKRLVVLREDEDESPLKKTPGRPSGKFTKKKKPVPSTDSDTDELDLSKLKLETPKKSRSAKKEPEKPKTPRVDTATPKKAKLTTSARRKSEVGLKGSAETPKKPVKERGVSKTPSKKIPSKKTPSKSKGRVSKFEDTESDDYDDDDSIRDELYKPAKDDSSAVGSEDDDETDNLEDESEDEEEEEEEKKRRSKKTPNKKANSKNGLSSRKKKKGGTRVVSVPTTPSRKTLETHIPKSSDSLEIVRERLHQSVAPEVLPCREEEFADIYQYVRDKIIDGCGGCMYISGVPGTGKTATVRQVVSVLEEEHSSGDLPYFKFIEVNGMRVTNPHQVNVQIFLQLTGQKVTPEHACNLLDKRFKTKDPHRDPVILLVDELDLLWTRKQTIMYNLFDWPSQSHSKLIVVAIANTMDLPERMMMARVASRLGLTRLTFQPYTHQQLQEVVISRLKGLDAFDEDAIQLVARKVAAVSGDARRALEICRRATEFVDMAGGKRTVSTAHVDAAIQEMFSSPKVMAVKCASEQEKIFLRALMSEFQRSGLEEATLRMVLKHHVDICRIEGMSPPTVSQVFYICSKLSSFRLLLTDSQRKDIYQKIRLNISQDDLSYALK